MVNFGDWDNETHKTSSNNYFSREMTVNSDAICALRASHNVHDYPGPSYASPRAVYRNTVSSIK